MKKILFILFILFFYLDFSFVPGLLGAKLNWSYFIFSLVLLLFILRTGFWESIIWGIFSLLFLNILMPFSFLGYGLILVIIWMGVYFIRTIFFDDELNLLRINIYFILFFVLFNILFFVGYNILVKTTNNVIFSIENINWQIETTKFFIGIVIYNLCYKLLKIIQVWKKRGIKVLK